MTSTAEPADDRHVRSDPAILYFGTPVVLLSTMNADGTANLAPMSSVFWLGWRAVLGLGAAGRTAENLRRTREVVLNLPTAAQVEAVDRLALTTGADPVPEFKRQRGYRHVAAKFARAGLTAVPSQTVTPPRAAECPVALEGAVEAVHGLADEDDRQRGNLLTFEVRIQAVHVHPEILLPGQPNRVDPDRWRPLIMSFQQFYGLGGQLRPSRLASIDEEEYRTADSPPAQALPA